MDRYATKDPSTTEVIGVLEKKGLHEWYDWQGDETCKQIVDASTTYGKKIHSCVKEHIEIGHFSPPVEIDVWPAHKIVGWVTENHPEKPVLVDPEKGLYSKKYKFWGTPDFVGRFIADWKTDSTPKTKDQERERLFKYGLQLVAYAILYHENYGIWVNEGWIVRANKKHDFLAIHYPDLKRYKKYFLELRRIYKCYRGK